MKSLPISEKAGQVDEYFIEAENTVYGSGS
jgi:hypothetical protein